MPRYEKVAQYLKEEVSIIIHDELDDPRLGFVTITRVELTPDLRFAKIYFSVLGKEEDYVRTKRALDSALGFIRRLIAQRINLRLVPEILFKEDHASEYSIRIQQILDEIKEQSQPQPSPKARMRAKTRKDGRGEPKKSRRMPKKK